MNREYNPIGQPHRPDSYYDPNELARGIEVEFEHTDDLEIAKGIAKDHLDEDPHYYAKLLEAGITHNPPQSDWVFAKDYNIYDDAELMDEVETAAQDAVLEDNEAIIIPAPMFTASWKDYPYEALHETTCRAVERHCSRHARFTGEGEELEDGRIRMYLRYPGGLR